MHACKFLCPGMWLFLAMPRERVFPVMAYTGRLRPKFSPRSKRFQSSYCAKVRAGAKKTVEGGGGGEKRKRLPVNPTILENAPWYFTARFTCELTARQNRSITNRLPLDHQISKITLNFSLIEHVPGDCKNCNKNVYDKRRLKLWAIAAELLVFYCMVLSRLKPCRKVKNDLSGTIHYAGYSNFCRAAAIQPVLKRSLQYMPINFQ